MIIHIYIYDYIYIYIYILVYIYVEATTSIPALVGPSVSFGLSLGSRESCDVEPLLRNRVKRVSKRLIRGDSCWWSQEIPIFRCQSSRLVAEPSSEAPGLIAQVVWFPVEPRPQPA